MYVAAANSLIHMRESLRKNLSRIQQLVLVFTSARTMEISRRNAAAGEAVDKLASLGLHRGWPLFLLRL